LGFPSGRIPIFATRFLQSAYIRFVSVVNTIGLRLFSAASLDCVFGKALPSLYVELIAIGFGPILFGSVMVLIALMCWSPLQEESEVRVLHSENALEDTPIERDKETDDSGREARSDSKYSAPLRLILFLFLLIYPYGSTSDSHRRLTMTS
jgi:hypothetical protein